MNLKIVIALLFAASLISLLRGCYLYAVQRNKPLEFNPVDERSFNNEPAWPMPFLFSGTMALGGLTLLPLLLGPATLHPSPAFACLMTYDLLTSLVTIPWISRYIPNHQQERLRIQAEYFQNKIASIPK